MNEIYAKQILKIFANNPFDSFNHKQISSRVGAHDKGSRQLVIATLQELAEAKILVADELGKVVNAGFSSINSLDTPSAAVTMLFYTFQIFFHVQSA